MPEETQEAAASATPPAKKQRRNCPGADEVYRGNDGLWEGNTTATGFSGKPASRSTEEYADALLELFERCRTVVNK